MEYKIVFSDVDGTLLSNHHQVLPGTLKAIRALQEQGIPFVIISGRSPSGIYPILRENQFNCPIISYSGGMIRDESGEILYSKGFSRETAAEVIGYIEEKRMDCSWNLYSNDDWLVKDKADVRVMKEENYVHAQSREGNVSALEDGAKVNKIMCICNPEKTSEIERSLKEAFPELSIAKSSDVLLEIMQNGVTKGEAIRWLCQKWDIPTEAAVAFGDNYNDVEMLETVGMPFLMGNAPSELKERFPNHTDDNDSEGIARALKKLGVIS